MNLIGAFTLILATFSIIQTKAHAQTPMEKITWSSIKVIGKGVQSKDSKNTIIFGCTRSYCSEIRPIFFDATTKEAFFFGDTFAVETEPGKLATKEAVAAALREHFSGYRSFNRKTGGGDFLTNSVGYVVPIALGLYLAKAVSPILGGMIGVAIIGQNIAANRVAVGDTEGYILSATEGGFTPPSDTKKVGSQRFNDLRTFLDSTSSKTETK